MHPYRILAVVSLTLTSFANSSLGQELSLRPDLIDQKTEKSIERGLAYLARAQDRQGTWRNAGTYGSYPVAMSSLAALAMLMSGSTMTEGVHAENINRAANYLLASARANGLIASPLEESRSMYGHGFSMLFLGQLYGMESNLELREKIARVLHNGVSLTEKSGPLNHALKQTKTARTGTIALDTDFFFSFSSS